VEIDPTLLDAVLADPPSDATREIVADWLDERGDSDRAAFVRRQLRAASLPAYTRAATRARREARALARAHERRWKRELPELEDVQWGELHRGFVRSVVVHRVGALFEQADRIWQHQPVDTVEVRPRISQALDAPARELPVRRVRLVDSPAGWLELDDSERRALATLLGPVEEIEIYAYEAEDEAYVEVLRGLAIPGLRTLKIRGHHTLGTVFAQIAVEAEWPLATLELGTDFVDYDSGYFEDPTLGPAGARLLAEASSLGGLQHLGLDLQRLGAPAVAELLDRFRGLETLSVRRMELVSLPAMPEGDAIRHLGLGHNDLDSGLDLLSQPRLHGLYTLDLRANDLEPDSVQHLVAAPAWATLHVLDLAENRLTGSGATFAAAPPPPCLHTLRLSDAELTSADVAALLSTPWVRSLESLDLGSNDVGPAVEGFAAARIPVLRLAEAGLSDGPLLAALDGLRHCERLDLSGNVVAGSVSALLRDAPSLVALDLHGVNLRGWNPADGAGAPRLATLNLAGTALGDEGLANLLAGPLGGRLVDLDLADCGLGPAAIEALVAWPRLGELHRLVLAQNNDIGEDDLVRLARALERPIPVIRLPGYVWRISEQARALFHERFGPRWNDYYAEDDDPEE